jgi:hypothetical protein
MLIVDPRFGEVESRASCVPSRATTALANVILSILSCSNSALESEEKIKDTSSKVLRFD